MGLQERANKRKITEESNNIDKTHSLDSVITQQCNR